MTLTPNIYIILITYSFCGKAHVYEKKVRAYAIKTFEDWLRKHKILSVYNHD